MCFAIRIDGSRGSWNLWGPNSKRGLRQNSARWKIAGSGQPSFTKSNTDNGIMYECHNYGANILYQSIPVELVRGKTLYIKGVALRTSGVDDAFYLATNFTDAQPSDLNIVYPKYFASSEATTCDTKIVVPEDATACNIGFRCGGANISGKIITFDAWIIDPKSNTIPDFSF